MVMVSLAMVQSQEAHEDNHNQLCPGWQATLSLLLHLLKENMEYDYHYYVT